MADYDAHANFAYSTVSAAPSPASSGTSLTLAADFPAAAVPPYNATVWPASTQPTASNAEIVRVTADASGVLTIVRAQEGSSARAIVVGDQIAMTITAKDLTDIEGNVGSINTVPTADVTIAANRSAVALEEYVMDATHELIFADPSELAVL